MYTLREMVWSGLVHTPEAQNVLIRGILSKFSPTKKDPFGSFLVEHYQIADNHFVVIHDQEMTRHAGIGILWPNEDAAKANLESTRKVLRELGIPGEPSVWKLSTTAKD
jgi:hypothetical protein